MNTENIIRSTPLYIVYIYTKVYRYIYVGWVGVGWQRHCKTCRSLRELDYQGTYLFFAVDATGGRVRSFVRGGEPLLLTRGMIGSLSVYGTVRHPRGNYVVTPLLSLEVATPENKSIHSTLSSICKEVRLTSGS